MKEQSQQKCTWTPRPPTFATKSIQLRAVVEGSQNPVKGTWPDKVINGGFTIQATSDCEPITGDGREEYTWWTFDFRQDKEWQSVMAIKRLGRVTLQLQLQSHDTGTDALRWLSSCGSFGGDPLNAPFATLGGQDSLTIELLEHWSPEEIIQALMTDEPGVFNIEHADDALIYRAELTIDALAYVRS